MNLPTDLKYNRNSVSEHSNANILGKKDLHSPDNRWTSYCSYARSEQPGPIRWLSLKQAL